MNERLCSSQTPSPSTPQKRVFTITKQFEGFDKCFSQETKHIVLVSCDGKIDVYALDDPKNLTEFCHFLSIQGGGLIGIFSR